MFGRIPTTLRKETNYGSKDQCRPLLALWCISGDWAGYRVPAVVAPLGLITESRPMLPHLGWNPM